MRAADQDQIPLGSTQGLADGMEGWGLWGLQITPGAAWALVAGENPEALMHAF